MALFLNHSPCYSVRHDLSLCPDLTDLARLAARPKLISMLVWQSHCLLGHFPGPSFLYTIFETLLKIIISVILEIVFLHFGS